MALQFVPATTAFGIKNRFDRWDKARERLVPQAWPEVSSPPFSLKRGDKIFTIGSCFARNIEEQMGRIGFRVPMLDFTVPKSEHKGARGAGILNKYTAASIYQEVKWAADIRARDGAPVESDSLAYLYEVGDDGVLDNNLSDHIVVSRQRFFERRRDIYDVFSHAFDADCVVITPGLVEAWWDRELGSFIQEAPWPRELRAYRERCDFVQLDYAASYEYLQKTIDCIRSVNPASKFLITTSPVPLGKTFTSDDVILANTYAKSTLRAVCGDLVRNNDGVGYFPSYESVMLSRSDDIWEDDCLHITQAFVSKIVGRLTTVYYPDMSEGERAFLASFTQENSIDALDQAARACELEPDRAEFLDRLGVLRIHAGQASDAITPLRRAVELDDGWEINYHLALALQDSGGFENLAEARQRLESLLELKPDDADIRYRLVYAQLGCGALTECEDLLRRMLAQNDDSIAWYWLSTVLGRLERSDEAIAAAEKALALDPTNSHSWYLLGMHHRESGRLVTSLAAFRQAQALDGASDLYASTVADLETRLDADPKPLARKVKQRKPSKSKAS